MVFKIAAAFVSLSTLSFAATTIKQPTICANGQVVSHEACCPFTDVRDDLQTNLFGGVCDQGVQDALRLTFHDGIAFSLSGQFAGGGADGSILKFADIETAFEENGGTEDGTNDLMPFYNRHNVSAGDMIQFAAALGVSNCPGAPRLQFFAGRPEPTAPAQDGAVPRPFDSVDTILERFADAGFSSAEVVHLLASHTIADSNLIVPGHLGVPFDSTPFDFDGQFFLETLISSDDVAFGREFPDVAKGETTSPIAKEGGMRLMSDFLLARDQRTACEWQSMIDNQYYMANSFKKAMFRLSIVGQDIDQLVDCSDLIPIPPPPRKAHTTFPPTLGMSDILPACRFPFPSLSTDPGEPTEIPACANGSFSEADCPD